MTAEEIIMLLGLRPHPEEGGYFRETYRNGKALEPIEGAKSDQLSTAIYYLLTPDTVSAMHRLKGDELFHFHGGDPVVQLQCFDDGHHEIHTLGMDLRAGQRPQVLVPGGVWQGAKLAPGGSWALLGCTCAPAFVYEDYDHGDIEALVARFPEAERMLRERA